MKRRTEKDWLKQFPCYECLNRKQKIAFKKLSTDTRKFEVIEDRQCGTFGMGRVYTIQEWVENALEWLDSDGYIEEDQIFINHLLKGTIHAIESIDDFWDITFSRVTKAKRYLIKELNKKVCSLTEAHEIEDKQFPFGKNYYTIIDLKTGQVC